MVLLTLDNLVYQAMDSTVLVHPKRADMWHSKNHGIMDLEMENKGMVANTMIHNLIDPQT